MKKKEMYEDGVGAKHKDYNIKDIKDFPVWDLMRVRYGVPLFEQGLGAQVGLASKYVDQEILAVYITDKFDTKKYSLPTHVGCNFAKGLMHRNGSLSKITLGDSEVEHNKLSLDNVISLVPVLSLSTLNSKPLLQFTFYTGHTRSKNGVYLRDVIDTNPFTAANKLLEVLAKESNLHIPIRLYNIQLPEEKLLNKGDTFKSGMVFERDELPEYDGF